MNCHLVVEGDTDVLLLRWLLRPEWNRFGDQLRIKDAGGRSGVASMAQTILAIRREPVAIVLDADSTDPAFVEERKDFLRWWLGEVASPDQFKIIFFAPSIESLLFQDGAFLQDILGRRLDEVQRIRGHYEPKKVLPELAQEQKLQLPSLLQRITSLDPEPLRQIAPLPELIDYLTQALCREAAPVRA